jgi:intracellular multiplication protein IcmP
VSQPQKSPHEDFIIFTSVCLIIGTICFFIWYYFSVQLTEIVRWVRIGELHLVQLFYGDDATVNTPAFGRQGVVTWREWLERITAKNFSPADIEVSTYVAVIPLRLFFCAIMGCMGLYIMFKGPNTRYRRRMGLQGLMNEQAKSFPIISPFLKFDPRKMPIRVLGEAVPAKLPPFAEALSPEEWLAHNEVRYTSGNLDANAVYRGLVVQLGKRWQGPLKMAPHMQGLYAAFALKFARKRKESDEMLNNLARAWSPDKGFRPTAKLMSEIRKIIKNPKMGGKLQSFSDQHAYETTAMLRALARCREEGGVLAPAQFAWLRGYDRALWYPLNNLGRKSYHPEASGAMVHYTNEIIAGQKIPTPRFDEVIRGFENYMKSAGARAIPELDKSNGKKAK